MILAPARSLHSSPSYYKAQSSIRSHFLGTALADLRPAELTPSLSCSSASPRASRPTHVRVILENFGMSLPLPAGSVGHARFNAQAAGRFVTKVLGDMGLA
jgi:hypothetical protein